MIAKWQKERRRRSVYPWNGNKMYPSTIFGPTCDGLDTVLRNVWLPELACGDWLVFPRMGAYTQAAGSSFNGFSSSEIQTHYVYSPEKEKMDSQAFASLSLDTMGSDSDESDSNSGGDGMYRGGAGFSSMAGRFGESTGDSSSDVGEVSDIGNIGDIGDMSPGGGDSSGSDDESY